MDCSLPSSSVHGILQARILERVASELSGNSIHIVVCLCQSQSSNLFLLHFPLANKFVFYIYYVGKKPLPYYFIVVATMSRYSKKKIITQFHITYTRKTSIKKYHASGKTNIKKNQKNQSCHNVSWKKRKKK